MFDLKVIHSVLDQLKDERGIPKEKIIEAIEAALATAYRKEFGKRGQIIRSHFDINTGKTEFSQVKVVVDPEKIIKEDDDRQSEIIPDDMVIWNNEQHILLEDARRIKKDANVNDEIVFPLENQEDFGRIASQTAKQVIIQKIREAEKVEVFSEYGKKEGEIVTGEVGRIEHGTMFVEMGRAIGSISYEDQIKGERFKQGEKIRAFLYKVEDTGKGIFLKLSRSHPQFLQKLFEIEAPEVANGTVEFKAIAREAGSRSKVAVITKDDHVDPVGSLVGQRGVRVSTVMSELGGEKIDIIEYSEDPKKFIEDALSPARILDIEINEEDKSALVTVSGDQQSLAIGRGGQNVRLAAKLTGWKIEIKSDENISDENISTKDNSVDTIENVKVQEDVLVKDIEQDQKEKNQ